MHTMDDWHDTISNVFVLIIQSKLDSIRSIVSNGNQIVILSRVGLLASGIICYDMCCVLSKYLDIQMLFQRYKILLVITFPLASSS